MPIQLNSAQAGAISRLETQLETANLSGVEFPPGTPIIDKMDQYDKPIIVNGLDQTSIYKPKLKGPFKALIAALMGAIESWNEVGSLSNGWTSFDGGSTFTTPAYYRTILGEVRLKGLIKSGTVGTGAGGQVFQLPTGYRPAKTLIFGVSAGSAFGEVRIDNNGWVYAAVGTNTATSLDGVSFRAEQ